MPIYEYECKKCGHTLEVIQSFSDAPLKKCPSCEQDKLEKLISAPAFQLKGNGWYETDFKTPKSPPACQKEASAETSSTGGCGKGGCDTVTTS